MVAKPEVVTPAPFKFAKIHPQLLEHGKSLEMLIRGQVVNFMVQVLADGGETNLHSHSGSEEIWLVLSGQATFYTTDDEIAGVMDKNEAFYVPAGAPYWFESTSEENLVMLRIGAKVAVEDQRTDHTPRNFPLSTEPGGRIPPVVKEGVFFGD
jgi:mannose-6-phosphate isomerase-like protein (cupin superfamily)